MHGQLRTLPSRRLGTTTRIVIADDHAVVRAGLRLVLDAEDGIDIQQKVRRSTRAELVRYALDHKLIDPAG